MGSGATGANYRSGAAAARSQEGISGCSGVWLPPPKYRNNEACHQRNCHEADLHPVPDRRGISMSNKIRPVQKPAEKITIFHVRDFSLDEAIPQSAAAIDTQIERDDASDDFIKEEPHCVDESTP
jgi:hypothetical protein